MIRRLVCKLVLLLFLTNSGQAKQKGGVECFVFIDAAVSEQLSLFKQFNQEYYLSPTLRDKGSITFINIGHQSLGNISVIPMINDTEGIWVRKFKPHSVPVVFSIQQGKHIQRGVTHTGEIRQCLQGQ